MKNDSVIFVLGYQAPQPRSPQVKPRPRMQRGASNSIRMNSMNSSMSSQQNFNQVIIIV